MKMKIKLNSLGVKLSLMFSVLMLASSTAIIFYSYIEQKNLLQKESQSRYNSIAKNLAFNAEYGVLTKNIMTINQIVVGVMQEKDVNYVNIKSLEGEVLSESGKSKQPSYAVTHAISTQFLDTDTGDFDSLYSPIVDEFVVEKDTSISNYLKAEKIGEVYIEFDTAPMQNKLNKVLTHAIYLSLFATLITILLTFLLVFLMVNPLKELALATGRVAKGELDVQVQTKTSDEIGDLASTFNTMTLNLKKSTVSMDYLDSIVDSITDSILVVNQENKITMVNQATIHLTGYEKEQIYEKSIEELISFDENIYFTSSGEKIPISISEGLIQDKSGQIKGTVFVAHDLRPINKLQDRLLQSEKMAAVGQLAAGVSHEINNPLGVILGFSQGLVRRMTPGSPMEIPLKSIEREAMRCKDLVQDLLTFSRSTHADQEPMDLNQAVEGALSLVQAQARMDKSEVKQNLAFNLPRILGNKNQVQQVVINLAKNAMDSMPKGGMVTVTTELVLDKVHSWIYLRVIDNGIGIPKDVLPRIFEPFFTTKPVGKGTGLGLSLVYEIVKKHSGVVEVQSRPGYTEFCVKFPTRTGREANKNPYLPDDKN